MSIETTPVNGVQIIPYEPAMQPHFERLNRAWIEKYFQMEPVDEAVLKDPGTHIIAGGGHIIFAAVDGNIAGTVALAKIDDDTVEMIKMAVDEAYQGRKIGKALCEAIVQVARDKGYKKVILYSNTRMVPAITMYRRVGFREVPADPGHYERCTIKMEMGTAENNAHHAVADALERTVTDALEQLQRYSEEEAANRTGIGRWSYKEIIGHLVDSAINNIARFIRAQQTPLLETPGYEQDFWVRAQAWQLGSWKEALELWAAINRRAALTIRAIPPAALQHRCKVGDREPVTLLYLVQDYLAHQHHHLKQAKVTIKQEDTI